MINSTFNQRDNVGLDRGEMSIDESLIEKETPPDYVTQRKMKPKSVAGYDESLIEKESPLDCGANKLNPWLAFAHDIRQDMQLFQSKIIETMEGWFTKYEEKFSKFCCDLDDVKKSMQHMSDQYDILHKKSEEALQRVNALEGKIKPQDLRISQLESKIDQMEQHSRMCNVEISNMPEKRGENLMTVLEKIGTLLKNPISAQDIVAVHRVPRADPRGSRPKNIIVKFTNRVLRDNFIAAARLAKGIKTDQINVNGPVQNIYINEHLTLKNKELFREAREAGKRCGYRFMWIKHGNILVRANDTSPVVAIRNRDDLSRIKPQHNG
ncbi:uncharacterized protein LOC114361182 [Ostrinia furnacalis]|uniref:uncharacterized protein LOC114361182 n=1 Tax=Ostrinia furnacalis TaxID=93504 RepID=UPI0010409A4C|nr:uncharacterized protein LOC114361182 [Ostrinia furnacalis]